MSKDESEFLKHSHEMTFKPKLAFKNNKIHQKDKQQKAAEERQEINNITTADVVVDSCSEIEVCETSLNSQSPESLKNQPAQNNHKKVNLKLDVNLGKGISAKMVIYEGDEIEQIVEDFSQKHALTQKKKIKLFNVIQSSILAKTSKNQNLLPAIVKEEQNSLQKETNIIQKSPFSKAAVTTEEAETPQNLKTYFY